jgi:hypothetical protein
VGNAKIWFTPAAASGPRVVEIDFGMKFSNRQGPFPVVSKSSTEGLTGERTVSLNGGRNQVVFSLRWDARAGGDGRLIRRKVYALVNHLARNGSCMVAEDADYAWACMCTHVPHAGDSKLRIGKTLFYPTVYTVPDVTGREVVVQSDFTSFLSEMKLVSTFSTAGVPASVTLNGGVAFDYASSADWAIVREYGSYPALRLPDDADPRSILTHDHENNWSIELHLEEDVGVLNARAAQDQDADGGAVGGVGGINPTWDDPLGGTINPGQIKSPARGGWHLP